MESSIIDFQEYTSAGNWRRPEQLRGLLRNHADLVADSAPLAAAGNIFTSARVALHDTERALAVSISPFIGAGSVGLLPLEDGATEPTLSAAASTRWLDLSGDVKTTSVEWCDDLLLLGSSRGRILIADLGVEACHEPSSALEPCGALVAGPSEPALADITVSPSSYAATTLVRSVSVNTKVNKSSVLGSRGHEVFVWDLNGGAMPVRSWAPHADPEDPSTVLFARWAPGSDSVVLSGNYDGTLTLVDTRCGEPGNGLMFDFREKYMASSGDFSTVMPFVFAASSSDGTFSVFDVRYTRRAVHTIASLQGDVSAVRWLKLQSDMLLTGGTDGSVSLWNLRCPPTYCVGRAQYQLPLTDLVTTETFMEQRGFGMTIGGELSVTGLRCDPMMALAPQLEAAGGSSASEGDRPGGYAEGVPTPEVSGTSFPGADGSGDNDVERVALAVKERRASGYLYTRRLQQGYQLLCECASARFAMQDSARSLQLVSLIDVNRTPTLDYGAFLAGRRRAAALSAAGKDETEDMSIEEAREAFEIQLGRTTSRLCTSVPLDRVRGLPKPDSHDIRILESLRLNTLLHRALATQDPERVTAGVRQALELLSAHPESFDLIDADTVCGIVSLLLRKNFTEGEKFVVTLLSFVEQAMKNREAGLMLIRRILVTVQEPLITGELRTRVAHRFEEKFLRALPAAKEAVQTQLQIQRLGVEHYREVIAAVTAYQGRCIEKRLPGMFGWLGVKPLILFLHCLTADSNYVTFFWTSVQLIEAFASFPLVRQIESVLFEVVGRIHTAATKIAQDLDDLAELQHFSIPILRQTDNTLRAAHSFLSVLLRVQLECENVALSSKMEEMPPVMSKIQDVLNTASEDVLDAWSGVIDALLDGGQPEVVRKYCLASVRDFSFAMEDLMEVSAKKEKDERLNEILDVCDDFMDTVAKRR